MTYRVVAELHCLNCARHLADLLLAPGKRARLDHPAGQDARSILVSVTRTGLRCARCGGRVLVERPLPADAVTRRTVRAA
jgi:DNA-directed RNA polymerase subunit RPC12/RpoP